MEYIFCGIGKFFFFCCCSCWICFCHDSFTNYIFNIAFAGAFIFIKFSSFLFPRWISIVHFTCFFCWCFCFLLAVYILFECVEWIFHVFWNCLFIFFFFSCCCCFSVHFRLEKFFPLNFYYSTSSGIVFLLLFFLFFSSTTGKNKSWTGEMDDVRVVYRFAFLASF